MASFIPSVDEIQRLMPPDDEPSEDLIEELVKCCVNCMKAAAAEKRDYVRFEVPSGWNTYSSYNRARVVERLAQLFRDARHADTSKRYQVEENFLDYSLVIRWSLTPASRPRPNAAESSVTKPSGAPKPPASTATPSRVHVQPNASTYYNTYGSAMYQPSNTTPYMSYAAPYAAHPHLRFTTPDIASLSRGSEPSNPVPGVADHSGVTQQTTT